MLLALPAKVAVKEKKLVSQMVSMASMAKRHAKTGIKIAAKKERRERKEKLAALKEKNPVVKKMVRRKNSFF